MSVYWVGLDQITAKTKAQRQSEGKHVLFATDASESQAIDESQADLTECPLTPVKEPKKTAKTTAAPVDPPFAGKTKQ